MTTANRHHRVCQSPAAARAGFTLMELLVTMGIIVLLLGMGVLAFNTLSGNRSISMAQNQVAALLARARAMSINAPAGEDSYGLAFFLDPQTDRTGVAFVRVQPTGGGDPDVHDNYKSWLPGVGYLQGDRVVAITRDDDEGGRPMARVYLCRWAHTSSNANRPPAITPNGHPVPFSVAGNPWQEYIKGGAIVLNEPVELLPKGVGVQTVVDVSELGGAAPDRYLRTGVILFDHLGRLEHLQYRFDANSDLARRMGVTWDLGSDGTPGPTLYSQFGVVIYDTEAFRSQHTEYDRWGAAANPIAWQSNQTAGNTPSAANEAQEEIWLDNNGAMFIINRYSGEMSSVR